MEVNSGAWLRAAEFWALVRRAGRPTADPHADLDGDAILAAVAATIVGDGDAATIATTNVSHLARFPGGSTPGSGEQGSPLRPGVIRQAPRRVRARPRSGCTASWPARGASRRSRGGRGGPGRSRASPGRRGCTGSAARIVAALGVGGQQAHLAEVVPLAERGRATCPSASKTSTWPRQMKYISLPDLALADDLLAGLVDHRARASSPGCAGRPGRPPGTGGSARGCRG